MTHQEWIEEFDAMWQLTDWLSEYATIYAKPELDSFDQNYQGFIAPEKRPDFFLDFNNGPLTACFFEHAEDISSLGRAFSATGRFAQFVASPGSGHILDENGNERYPEMAVIGTQFSPFGRVLAEECTITNQSVNSLLENVDTSDDFFTHFLIHQLHNTCHYTKQGKDVEIARYGLLLGNRNSPETFKPPTALVQDNTGLEPKWIYLSK